MKMLQKEEELAAERDRYRMECNKRNKEHKERELEWKRECKERNKECKEQAAEGATEHEAQTAVEAAEHADWASKCEEHNQMMQILLHAFIGLRTSDIKN